MKRIMRMFGLGMVLSAVLVVSVTGTVFAANPEKGNGNLGTECPYCDGVCGDCEPNFHNWDYNYESPGPHGAQNGVVTD